MGWREGGRGGWVDDAVVYAGFGSGGFHKGSPHIQQGGMGERCKLPHWGLGRSLSRFAIFKSQNIT